MWLLICTLAIIYVEGTALEYLWTYASQRFKMSAHLDGDKKRIMSLLILGAKNTLTC
jgi:hypothetical protein